MSLPERMRFRVFLALFHATSTLTSRCRCPTGMDILPSIGTSPLGSSRALRRRLS